MIAKKITIKLLLLMVFGMTYGNLNAQIVSNPPKLQNTQFYELRGANAVDFGAGTVIMNGDLIDPEFELYFHVGYKRYLFPHLNINFSYNKFNLAYKDIYNEGFMSFDLNLESTLFPHHRFSPFVFAGGGYNASNGFDQTALKVQGGGGIEYVFTEGMGLKLYTDYNYVMSDDLDGLIAGESDDTYFRIGFGLNYYFGSGKKKKKILKDQPTIINSNQIFTGN